MYKRITFSQLLRDHRDWLDMSIAGILLGLSIATTPVALGQCHPPTPCPCAADGMCYPKRDTWGIYSTNWRPFPGDNLGLKPTAADGGAVDIQDKLPTFIVPAPDKEDLRGPVRATRPVAPTKSPAAPAGAEGLPPLPQNEAPQADGEEPAAPAAEEAPGPLDNLDLPGFGDPQGMLHPLPRIEDGPPELPSALSHAITMGAGQDSRGNFPVRTAHVMPKPSASANHSKPQPKVATSSSRVVTPAAANIALSNPAAKHVQKTMDQELQQAIYYEASDLDALK